METAWCAVDVAADCAVAEVDFEGEGFEGECYGELDGVAMAGCFESFGWCHCCRTLVVVMMAVSLSWLSEEYERT